MEYIEQPQVPVKPHAKRNKYILFGCITSFIAVLIGVVYYLVINYAFINYMNIEYLEYTVKTNAGSDDISVRIDKVTDSPSLPTSFRVPTVLDGYPVDEIGSSAFAGITKIESVTLPDTVEYIGEYAFSNCVNLESFNAPKGLTNIGYSCFQNTKWYEEQQSGAVLIGNILYSYKGQMPNGSVIIGKENSSLTPIDNGISFPLYKYINMSEGVFSNQPGIVKAELPSSFDTIDASTFLNCTSLEEIITSDSITTIGDNAFSGAVLLKDFDFDNENLSSIGSYAFSNTAIEGHLELHDKLTSIGDGAFKNCSKLTSVNLPSTITKISKELFLGCSNLASINYLGDEKSEDSIVTSIGEYAFAGTDITSAFVPFSVRKLESGAFANCTNLEFVEVYDNLEGTKFISSIEDVLDEDGNPTFDSNGDKVTNEVYSYQGLYTTGNSLFQGCTSFDSLILIDKEGTQKTSLGSVNFPATLVSLGEANTQTQIFSKTAVSDVNFKQNSDLIEDPVLKNISRKISIVNQETFKDATLLQNISFGASDEDCSITSVERANFSGCSSLVSISFPSTITKLGADLFLNCTSLENVTLPSKLTTMNAQLLSGCSALETIFIPKSVYTLNEKVFEGCTSLQNINIEADSDLTSILGYAFKDCTSLSSFTLPSSVKTIGQGIFSGCTALVNTNVSSNASFTTVQSYMFENTGITSMTLTSNIKTINAHAFLNSKDLASITLEGESKVRLMNANAFEGTMITSSTGSIIVRSEELVELYKNDSVWSAFKDIIIYQEAI